MSAYSDNFNDRLLLDILQLSKDATAIYSDSELTIQFANAAMLGIWRKEASIIGMHLENAIPEIKDQPFIELLKNAWRTGETYEARDTRADLMVNGKLEPFYFDFVYRPLKNEEGKVFCILHTATEVSDRIMAWKAVADREESEKRLMLQLAASNEELQASNEDLAILNKEYQATNASLKQLNSAYNLLIKQLNENNITLGESGKSFRALIEQAPVAMMLVKGADLRIEMINAGMLELIGKDSSVTGKGLFEEMPELWGQPPAEMLFATFRTGKINRGESKQVNLYRNGELKACYFDFTYAPFLENGIVTGVIDIAVEVTEQVLSRMQKDQIIAEKTALEDTLRKSEQRLQGILDTMAEGVGITDATGKLIYANRMAQEIFGLTENETNVQSYNDPQWHNLRIDGSPLADNEHPMAIMMRTGKPIYDHEIAIQPPDGERKYISVNAAPIFNEEGELTGGIGTFMNVTSRRLITQQKDDFISIASHELKTPVTTLKAALQLLSRGQESVKPEMHTRMVEQSMRSLDKLTRLIDDLLDTNRISQGHLLLQKTLIPVSELFKECCDHVINAGTHQIVFTGNQDVNVYADEQQINQVLVNFVNNAVKYAPNSNEIVIGVEQLENQLKISITDKGPGIPAEKLSYLFERYYRADHSGAKFSGLGLGLYISSEIIKKHGGAIGVESTVGRGSTFWFTLPLTGSAV